MQRIGRWIPWLLLAGLTGGCSTPQKTFKVSSFPEGATIYVDDEPRGQTPDDRLKITFSPRPMKRLRLEKDGYQPVVDVLSFESREELYFALQESPNNQKILKSLNDIQRTMEKFPNQLSEILRKDRKSE